MGSWRWWRSFICIVIFACCFIITSQARIFMVLTDKDPGVLISTTSMSKEKVRMGREHDMLLESILQEKGHVYTKLYSYTHLLNGFALHLVSDDNDNEILHSLRNAPGVRAVYEDMKMEKTTTYTPNFLGIPSGVWPTSGGADHSGDGTVIGMIDTGIDPSHPSFRSTPTPKPRYYKGRCETGDKFPETACNGKIVGAQVFAQAAIASGEFNVTRDYASPFDGDGHGSHTASIAAGRHGVPVIVNDFNYGLASGMAPGARIAIYKACYTFGGYMSDVVAAVDQAVEDGVDILSLSVGPSSVPTGPSAFLNILEIQLLFATKAGVVVVQSAGNNGPSSMSMLSFSPWITSVAASTTDRSYNNTIRLGNGQSFLGIGLTPPTTGQQLLPIAAAADVCQRNLTSSLLSVESCQNTEPFIPSLVRGKIIICTYNFDFDSDVATIATVADTLYQVGAAGFIIAMDPDIGPDQQIKGLSLSMRIPGVILNDMEASSALLRYYSSNTVRSITGSPITFRATARILDGREAMYSGKAPVVASYSSRGPDVNNALMETADVLKPNIMAPGSSIWAAWSTNGAGDQYIRGQSFALLSGTSMATPHVAGIAALIKQKHPTWSPSEILSALMTTADVTDKNGSPILAQQQRPATPFDYGAGSVNVTRAIDPGLVFHIEYKQYIDFLCSVPGVDDMSVRRAIGGDIVCDRNQMGWCSDLNVASVTVSNLVGSRIVSRRVTNVGDEDEKYKVIVTEPLGVNVTVSPQVFMISVNHSRHLKFVLRATQITNAYSFGEIVLQGDKNHRVRISMAVYVSSSLG